MARDLRDVMAENLGAREQSIAGLEPTTAALARTVRTVRRRRTVRHSSQAVGAVAVVAVLAAGSWFGLRGVDEPVPAVTPTPTPTAPTSTPSPTPSATPVAVPDDLLGLPPTYALPAGLLEQTTPGWVLAIYQSIPMATASSGEDEIPPAVVNTVVLIAPTGAMYRVVDLPADTNVSLLRWDAGSTTAVVRIDGEDGTYGAVASRAVLDLASGTVTPTDLGLQGGSWYDDEYIGQAADGAELWAVATSTDAITADVVRVAEDGSSTLVGGMGYRWMLDPTRRWMVSNVTGTFIDEPEPFVLLDVVSGGRVELSYGVPGQRCQVVGWLDPGQILAYCLDAGYADVDGIVDPVTLHAAYYRVDVGPDGSSTSLLSRPAEGEPQPTTWHGGWAGPGTLVVSGTLDGVNSPSGCAEDAYVWTGTALRPTAMDPGATIFSFRSGQPLLVQSESGCSSDASPSELRSFDAASGSTTVLAPVPSSTAEVPEWSHGLHSWVPAG